MSRSCPCTREYTAILRAGNVSNKYIVYSLVPINIISGSFNAASKSLKPYLKKSQQDIAISARVATPGNLVVVLAIGEASRKKNFGVYGYERRNTTPVLAEDRRAAPVERDRVARLDLVCAAEDPGEERHQAHDDRVPGGDPDGLLRELHALRQLRSRRVKRRSATAVTAASATTKTSSRC